MPIKARPTRAFSDDLTARSYCIAMLAKISTTGRLDPTAGLLKLPREEKPAPVPAPSENLAYVNGVLMKRVQTCHQEIVRDSFGDQYVVNKCNYIYVPVE